MTENEYQDHLKNLLWLLHTKDKEVDKGDVEIELGINSKYSEKIISDLVKRGFVSLVSVDRTLPDWNIPYKEDVLKLEEKGKKYYKKLKKKENKNAPPTERNQKIAIVITVVGTIIGLLGLLLRMVFF